MGKKNTSSSHGTKLTFPASSLGKFRSTMFEFELFIIYLSTWLFRFTSPLLLNVCFSVPILFVLARLMFYVTSPNVFSASR